METKIEVERCYYPFFIKQMPSVRKETGSVALSIAGEDQKLDTGLRYD